MAKSVQCSLSFSTVAQSKICYLVNCYCNDLDIKLVFTTFIRRNLFSVKNSVPRELRSHVMYKFTCACCNACFFGETGNHFSTCICEHLSSDKVCSWCVFFRTISLLKVQWSALQIGQDSSIYILDVILG